MIAYDAEMRVRTIIEVARGTYTNLLVHFPVLFGAVIASGCDRFAIAHNHPSDNPDPTLNDRKLTVAVMEQANSLGLYFENHYIVTPSGRYTNFTDRGYMIPAAYGHEGDQLMVAASKEKHEGEPH